MKANMKRQVYILLGCIFLGLSFVGAAVPLLPAFPFVVLTAYFFGRSSKRLHHWFINTNLYQNNFDSYLKGKGMTDRTKMRIIVSITITMGIGFYFLDKFPVGRVILFFVWVGHIIYFIFGVKTMKENEK